MKVLGLWSGHDSSFCVLNDGDVEMHTELERHLREKEPAGDSVKLFFDHYRGSIDDVNAIALCHPTNVVTDYKESWQKITNETNSSVFHIGHHQAHAAGAFYSSNFDEAIVITLDGGGLDAAGGMTVGASIWHGKGSKLKLFRYFSLDEINVGGIWSRVTRHVFGYESGWPQGNQAGTVMALAAMSQHRSNEKNNPYLPRFMRMFGPDLQHAVARAPGHVKGMSAKDPRNQRHPYLGDLADIATKDEQARFDMAGALQHVTETMFAEIFNFAKTSIPNVKNVCFAGGVALNSVAMGHLAKTSPSFNFYVPPVPYDAGLTIGAAQYVWHHVLDNKRMNWNDCASPYLGQEYDREEVERVLQRFKDKISVKNVSDDEVVALLTNGNIISVFNGSAESGRRALGNRSILADPRSPTTKDKVNANVKHRQSFRPFAPSVLREHVSDWFETDVDSPYMGFVVQFKTEKRNKVPAVVHFDGSARLQTVTKETNSWYHGFISKFYTLTGVPVLLNTSYNDREPIVETPEHAVSCFLGTEIDVLYFPEHGLAVRKT